MKKIKLKYLKIFASLILGIVIACTSQKVYAKYVIENEFYIANINVDNIKPKIELVEIKNSNDENKNYASKKHTLTIRIKITEKNIKNLFLNNNYIKVKIGNDYVSNPNIKIIKIKEEKEQKIYDIQINSLKQNGLLKVEILEGMIVDNGNLVNDRLSINTNIIIDNIAPTGKFIETKISDGKSKATITLSEQIKQLSGWNMSANKLKIEKEFTNNISYKLPIYDLAENEGNVEINILKATYIKINYASHNSMVGWSFGYGNYDVAGKEAVKTNSIFKTEALAFNINGNIDNDFVQAKAYVHTYWGEGKCGKCTDSGLVYNYGNNPKSGYKSMKSPDLVTLQGKKYFQFGGAGINQYNNTDINGNNPIPMEVASSYRYGISGITFKLKDYKYYSIIYQILLDKVGWIKACSDGQECMYAKNKPMSSFRIALVPKTEKQYVINTWNKDVGTFNFTK